MKTYKHLVEDLELSMMTYEVTEIVSSSDPDTSIEEARKWTVGAPTVKYGVGGFGSSFSQKEKEDYIGHDEADDEDPRFKGKSVAYKRAANNYATAQQHPHEVHINGKKWKTFDSEDHANNIMKSMLRKDPSKKITVVKSDTNGEVS